MTNEATAPLVVTEVLPPVRGAPGLAQGAYGDAGNLELVVPDRERGFWCFWWNADPVDSQASTLVGAWSGGLHVDGGRLDAVRVTQVQSGPRFLEVAGVGGDALLRWYWTPSDGFVSAGTVATSVLSASAVVEDDDHRLHAIVVGTAGTVTHLSAPPDGYPEVTWDAHAVDDQPGGTSVDLVPAPGGGLLALLVGGDGRARCLHNDGRWREEPGPPGTWRTASLVGGDAVMAVGLDRSGGLQVARRDGRGWTEPVPARGPEDRQVLADLEHVTAAATSLEGGRVDVVVSGGGRLWHLSARTDQAVTGPWSCDEVVSRVWCTGEPATLHRR